MDVRELQIGFPAAAAIQFALADHALAAINQLRSEPLEEAGRVTPPLPLVADFDERGVSPNVGHEDLLPENRPGCAAY